MFGHTALWIHDERQSESERDLVYNFGTFDFGSPDVVPSFLLGKLPYWLSIWRLGEMLATYGGEGRGVRAQTLRLTSREIDDLERALIARSAPERSRYAYGYTTDNCTTRVRDVLDEVTHGALRRDLEREAHALPSSATTARARVRRLLAERPVLGPLLHASFGPALDRSLSPWDATFLPDDFADALAATVRDDGERTRWVQRDEVLQFPLHPLPTGESRDHGDRRVVVFGSLLSVVALLAGVARAQAGSAATFGQRRRFAFVVGLWGLFAGGLGTTWLLLGFVSPLLRYNANALVTSPLALGLVWLAPALARDEATASDWALRIVFGHTLAATVVLVGETLGAIPQANRSFALAMLLVWGAFLATWRPGGSFPVPNAKE